MNPTQKKRKYRLRTILLLVNLTVLILPLGSIFFFRIFENLLVRQTEVELISQAAVISSMYKNQIVHSMFDPESYGKPLPKPEPKPDDEIYTPVLPELDLSEDPVLPPRPDGVTPKPDSRVDPVVDAIGKNLSSVLLDTKMTTLSAIKILDYHGNSVAGQSFLCRRMPLPAKYRLSQVWELRCTISVTIRPTPKRMPASSPNKTALREARSS